MFRDRHARLFSSLKRALVAILDDIGGNAKPEGFPVQGVLLDAIHEAQVSLPDNFELWEAQQQGGGYSPPAARSSKPTP